VCYGFQVGKIFALLRESVIFLLTTVLLIDLGRILEQTGPVSRGVIALLLLFSIIS